MGFEPSVESLREHTVPQWFHDAKFGIFIHWTMASIPAFAPQAGSLIDVVREHPADFLKYNPYAEWYWNAMKIPGSETALHHAEVYGDAPFEAFREPFEASIEAWNPEPLLDLIVAAGARYVVLVTKHHDGFALWPTGIENPHMPGWHTRRDMVGELARGIRERGLRFGVYYSGGLDWTFEPRPMLGVADLFASVPARDEYRQYADAHFRELIERYEPDVLWNDIAYPAGPGLLELFADFYNRNPEGVVNDRWAQPGTETFPLALHHDFRTPEYTQYNDVRSQKWEATRGIGHSFGYVANEDPADIITPRELIQSFVDAVAKNGNLLLNIGPKGNGDVDPLHEVPLRALGAWLNSNGEAVYGTRPWERASTGATDASGTARQVRFTRGTGSVFATVFDTPVAGSLRFPKAEMPPFTRVMLIGHGALSHREAAGEVVVDFPAVAEAPAHCLKLEI